MKILHELAVFKPSIEQQVIFISFFVLLWKLYLKRFFHAWYFDNLKYRKNTEKNWIKDSTAGLSSWAKSDSNVKYNNLTSETLRLDFVGAEGIKVEEKDALDLVTDLASLANLLRPANMWDSYSYSHCYLYLLFL